MNDDTIQPNGQQQMQDQDDQNHDEQNGDEQHKDDSDANNGISQNLNGDNEFNDLLSTNSDEAIRHDIVTPIPHSHTNLTLSIVKGYA